jgi:antitoxin component of MazEF toxin-antitoxin module
MTKRLIQHGNSAALVIDKAILDLLNVKIDTPLEITTDGKNIIISPQNDQNSESIILASLEKINQKHSKALRKLAK